MKLLENCLHSNSILCATTSSFSVKKTLKASRRLYMQAAICQVAPKPRPSTTTLDAPFTLHLDSSTSSTIMSGFLVPCFSSSDSLLDSLDRDGSSPSAELSVLWLPSSHSWSLLQSSNGSTLPSDSSSVVSWPSLVPPLPTGFSPLTKFPLCSFALEVVS